MHIPPLPHFLIDKPILQALKEDMHTEDMTTAAVIADDPHAEVTLFAKANGILAGMDVFARVFFLLDAGAIVDAHAKDGDAVRPGDRLATLRAPLSVLLSGERVALNFLQRMSGIATYTKQMVDALEGTGTRIVDTRKTTPNFRLFEKYAVRIGGGGNHRHNLSDGVMLKDNHIAACGSVKEAVERARAYAPFVRKIEVETETLEMVEAALEAGADIIMLDNMSPDEIREAVTRIDGRAMVELSGNIDLNSLPLYRDLGADIISCGALTHSAPILDLSLKELHTIDDR